MSGVALTGAQVQLNALTGVSIPVVSTSAPSTPIPGQFWINVASAPVNQWNGSAWVPATAGYLALLTADPTGQTTIAGLTECADAGYTRQLASFAPATSVVPSTTTNTSLIVFGPFSVNMTLPAQWLALVSSSSGTNGFLLETWALSAQEQVLQTQTVDIPAGALLITQS